jgi:hypothetical protein
MRLKLAEIGRIAVIALVLGIVFHRYTQREIQRQVRIRLTAARNDLNLLNRIFAGEG